MANAIWTPDGVQVLGAKIRERVELSPGQLVRMTQFFDVARAFELGVRCLLRCDAGLVGKNDPSDRVYSVSCGCRDFMGPTPRSVDAVIDVLGWLKSFEAMTKTLQLQMYCSRCGKDMKQAVASDDRSYSVACPCRELKPKRGGQVKPS